MTFYAHNGEFGLTLDHIRRRFPTVSIPATGPTLDDVVAYQPAPTPDYDPATHVAIEIMPANALQQWRIDPLPAEVAAENLRQRAEQLRQRITDEVQQRLDAFARTRGYDGILSAATYATSGVAKFQQEGQRAVDLRDATWAAAYTILAEVESGSRPVPVSVADIEGDLPGLTW